jgi:hypothetical protein
METIVTKVCRKCRKEGRPYIKPVGEFNKNRAQKDGLSNWCKECDRKAKRDRHAANSHRYNETRTHWRHSNREKFLEQQRSSNHQCRQRRYERNGREHENSLVKKAAVRLVEWKDVLEKYGARCLYPGCDSLEITMDHVKPLSRGGTHTADNLQSLCQIHNSKKSAKYIDYRPTLAYLKKPEMVRQNGC